MSVCDQPGSNESSRSNHTKTFCNSQQNSQSNMFFGAESNPGSSSSNNFQIFEQQRSNSSNKELRTWTPFPLAQFTMNSNCPPGHSFQLYDAALTKHFDVPSQDVVVTHGAVRYAEHFNEHGPYSKFRFQLCSKFLNKICSKGAACTYIHASKLPQGSDLHVLGGKGYEMMPAGVNMYVYKPNDQATPQTLASELLLKTVGAQAVMDTILGNTTTTTVQRPQHCAHFQFRKVCNRGGKCNFIHSTEPLLANSTPPLVAMKGFGTVVDPALLGAKK